MSYSTFTDSSDTLTSFLPFSLFFSVSVTTTTDPNPQICFRSQPQSTFFWFSILTIRFV